MIKRNTSNYTCSMYIFETSIYTIRYFLGTVLAIQIKKSSLIDCTCIVILCSSYCERNYMHTKLSSTSPTLRSQSKGHTHRCRFYFWHLPRCLLLLHQRQNIGGDATPAVLRPRFQPGWRQRRSNTSPFASPIHARHLAKSQLVASFRSST